MREMDAPLVRLDQQVEVTVGALPGRRFEARITSIGAGLDPATRRLTVRVEVQDTERLLKPEMFATFNIVLGEPRRSVAVPAGAGDCQVVEVAVALGRAARRRARSHCRPGTRLLPPDPEGLGAGAAVLRCGHQMPPRAEVAVDHGVG